MRGDRQKRRRHIKLAERGGRAGAAKGGMGSTLRGRAGSVHPVEGRRDDTKTEKTNQTTCIPTQTNTQRNRHQRGPKDTADPPDRT